MSNFGCSEKKEKFRERKIKVFLGENLKCGILLSSHSLVGLLCCETWLKKMKLEFIAREKKCFSVRDLCLTHVWAPCCKTWLKFEIAEVRVAIAKKI